MMHYQYFYFLQYHRDPEVCSNYWSCYNGCAYEQTCQNGLVWNPTHNYCDWPSNVDCNDTNPNPNPHPDPGFDCPEHDGFYADENNCMKYYECRQNKPNHLSCNKSKIIYSLNSI